MNESRLPLRPPGPCIGKCPYGVPCAPLRCYERERIEAQEALARRREALGA